MPTDENASYFGQLLSGESFPTFTDENATEEPAYEDTNLTNWLFYRDFLARMDMVYAYGTKAVIIIGSGVDYSLYRLVSNDRATAKEREANLSAAEDESADTPQETPVSNESDTEIGQYVSSRRGKTELPQQLASRDRRKGEQTYLIARWFDAVRFDDSYLDRTNRSYVRIRGGYAYDFIGDDKYLFSVTARVMIPRTQEKLDLIIGDETKNSSDLSLEGTTSERDNSVALGANNVLDMLGPVESKLRFGITRITNPYAKAVFQYQTLLGKWLVLPSQTFKYSMDNAFEEWTNLDFRQRLRGEMMFSLLFQRSTESEKEGMEYFVQPAVSMSLGDYGNLVPYMGLYGRTKKQPAEGDGYEPKRGVYRYAVGINWSKQAKRKYIVYRIQPILSYDDQYDFRPNYYVKALLEFYFGLRD